MKAGALELGLPVSDDPAAVAGCGADLGVVVAYGRIIRPELLAAVPMINVHFSLLPRWRGAAPVERAILAGDERTGVDVMVVEEGLDTGAVYTRAETDISDHDTASELAERLVALGVPLLVDTLRDGLRDPAPRRARPPTPRRSTPPSCASTGPAPPSRSTGWSAWSGPGPPFAAGASRSWPATRCRASWPRG